ncbi:hypothetical protein GCM10011378_16600 [Hymenobacter glacieicola]|uniref:Cytochrome c domain-containing protein n=2 Tax=Hymenobacter glacieicola TaxID=1562124 RepID=A0ABQ1WRM2_9BACT|nr:hypothetical protein GCM10011378_16600 [Hymenobacter glacieicola]
MVFGLSVSGLLEPEPAPVKVTLASKPDEPATGPASPHQLPAGADAEAVAAGDALFKANCAQCHAINEVVVGPALAGLSRRRPISWITAWVKNSSKMVAHGDEYAVKIFNQYQKQQMPSFQLSDQEIKAIVAYIESRSYQVSASGATGVAAL